MSERDADIEVEAIEYGCPNCGSHLKSCRRDKHQVGQREISMHWMCCEGCKHVMLRDWAFTDGGPRTMNASACAARDKT